MSCSLPISATKHDLTWGHFSRSHGERLYGIAEKASGYLCGIRMGSGSQVSASQTVHF